MGRMGLIGRIGLIGLIGRMGYGISVKVEPIAAVLANTFKVTIAGAI
ncbi:MAG: hypothetical protein OEY38_01045 [Gammaproteobacteria bacterium]|nr:hypothetical protein [Gammaproteobacteria bacterium]